jgi:hypothetical protein
MPGGCAAGCVTHLHEVIPTDAAGDEVGAAGNDAKVAIIDAAAAHPIAVIRVITCSPSLARWKLLGVRGWCGMRSVWRENATLQIAQRDRGSRAVIDWIIGTWLLWRQTRVRTTDPTKSFDLHSSGDRGRRLRRDTPIRAPAYCGALGASTAAIRRSRR